MSGDIERQLWDRLVELRADSENLLDLVERLDLQSEHRVAREVTRITRRRILDLPPPPTHHTLLPEAVHNTQSHFVDLQVALDELRAELTFDYCAIHHGIIFVQRAILCTRSFVSIGLPDVAGPIIARFFPLPTRDFPIPATRSVATLPLPRAD